MPRDGSGASDNGPIQGHDVVHGAGDAGTTHVARADKTATPPPAEKGGAIDGLPASGQGSQGVGNTGQGSGHTQGSKGGN